jgi:hypothetical protein
MKPSLAFALIVCFAAAASARAADSVKIEGRVVTNDGRASVGARVSTGWYVKKGVMEPDQPAVTDADGRFRMSLQFYAKPIALIAIDRAGKSGGMAVVEAASAAKPVSIKLEPLVHIHGRFFCKETGQRPPWTNVYMMHLPTKVRVLACDSELAEFSFVLPPGEYRFWGYGTNIKNHYQNLTLSSAQPEVELGTIDVPATVIGKHIGKAPPAWKVTDARGLKKDVRLEDFKGKWVLLEFWGFW